MTEQQVEKVLWDEFEQELKKTQEAINLNPTGTNLFSTALQEFWEKFLQEPFPKGQINSILEKNLAVWICQNKIPIEKIKEKYSAQNWKIGGLLGWIKKVSLGEIKNFNIKELLTWSNNNGSFLTKLLEQAKEELNTSISFKVLSDSELSTYESPTGEGFLVENFVGVGKMACITGKRSSYKSWMCINLAYSVAEGVNFLGKFQTQKANVLYLDKENSFSELKKRALLIKSGLNIKNIDNLFFVSETDMKLDSITKLKLLESFIQQKEIKLVIVDTYRRAISFDEDKALFVSEFFVDMLKPLCDRTGCSFLFIHHNRKGISTDEMDDIRGSSDFANYLDSIITLQRKGTCITFKQNKNRNGKEIEPFNIKVETDDNNFNFIYEGKKLYKEDRVSQKIIEWILAKKLVSFSYTQGLNDLRETKDTYTNALNKLQDNGILMKEAGKFGKYIVSKDLGGQNNE